MTSRKALEQWETKLGNCEVTPQDLWSIAQFFMKRYGPKAPIAVHGPLGMAYHPNAYTDCLENQFTSHYLCDKNHERRVEIGVQALLASVNDTNLGKVRPCDIHKLVKWLKLRKACGLFGIPNECLTHLPRTPLVYLAHLFNRWLRLSHFPKSCKEAKIITSLKPGKDPKLP
jgi:hypothetical protein